MEENSKISSLIKVKLYNIDNVNFNSKKQKINSPRSIEAIKRCGFELIELYFIDFKKFKEINPDLIALSKEVQVNRYEFHEKKRQEKIDEIKITRQKIIIDNENNNKLLKSSQTNGTAMSNHNNFNSSKQSQETNEEKSEGSTALTIEMKALERLKKKQQMEVFHMVQNELKNEIIRKENEDKIKKQRLKEERNLYSQHLKKKEEEFKKKQKEMEKQEQQRKEEQERKKIELEKYKEEQKKAKEEQKLEKERLMQAKLKSEEDKLKQEEFKKQISHLFEEHQKKTMERQKKLELRENQRKLVLEQKRASQIMFNQTKKAEKQKNIEKTLKNLEESINLRKMEFENKQQQNEMKKQQFEYLRSIAFNNEKTKSFKKSLEIRKVIEKNKDLEIQKINDYNEKQTFIQKRKEELKEFHEEEKRKKLHKIAKTKKKIESVLKVNEKQEETKKSKILEKINFNDEKKQYKNMLKEREMMEKSESVTLKRIERKEHIKKITQVLEYERQVIQEKLIEKSQKLSNFFSKKNNILNKKREFSNEMLKKKEEYMTKFQSIFKKKQLDENTIKTIEKMFQNNNELTELINSLKGNSNFSSGSSKIRSHSTANKKNGDGHRMLHSQHMKNTDIYNSISPNSTNLKNDNQSREIKQIIPSIKYLKEEVIPRKVIPNLDQMNGYTSDNIDLRGKTYFKKLNSSNYLNNNNVNNIFTKDKEYIEKEITKKIENYRLSLNQDLLKILAEERQKEDNRDRILSEAETGEDRIRLEKIFTIDRNRASNKIENFNKDIEEKIDNYTKKIRSSFNLS